MAPVPAGNRIVLALKGPPLEVTGEALAQRARVVSPRYGRADIAQDWLTALGLNQLPADSLFRQ
jgi:hypothetical protein